MEYSETQRRRLVELGAEEAELCEAHEDAAARNAAFRELELRLIRRSRERLISLTEERRRVALIEARDNLSARLRSEGFTEVATPTMITSEMLDKMTVTAGHKLREQIYWVDKGRCLRPMLAPNLYEIMRELHRSTGRPVRIFECGSCFRKESKGSKHLSEFTMLNLVEYCCCKDGEQAARLEELAKIAMDALAITDYTLVREASDVYGETLDIEHNGLELASGAYGPHPLDAAWGIFDETWVGLGVGVERAAMAASGVRGIKRVGRSLTFIDGAKLSL